MNFNRLNIDNKRLVDLYKSILVPRLIEEKMLILLRQGKISKWFSGIGQEAVSVGVELNWLRTNISYHYIGILESLPLKEFP